MEPLEVLLAWPVTDREREVIAESWPDGVTTVELATLTPEQLEVRLPRLGAAVGLMRSMPEELLLRAERLRLMHVLGHGVDGLTTPAVTEAFAQRGTVVARANPSSSTIAELIVMYLIAMSRRLMVVHKSLTDRGDWSHDLKRDRPTGSLGGELLGATVGLVGFGSIAQETARRLAPFGSEIITLTRRPERIDTEAHGVAQAYGYEQFDDFLSRCDHLVLAVPLTEKTRGLIDAAAFDRLRDGAFLVNISRGPLVVEDALWQALRSGKLAGAAIDVWDCEEEGIKNGYPAARPLHQYNVIMTPHYAGMTAETRARALRTIGENLRRLLAGEPLANVVDLDSGF